MEFVDVEAGDVCLMHFLLGGRGEAGKFAGDYILL